MNLIEMGGRIADFVLGPKVEGEVVLVLSDEISCDDIHLSRYAIRTVQKQDVIITVPKFASHTTVGAVITTKTPEFSRGEQVKLRAGNIKPWIEGQII